MLIEKEKLEFTTTYISNFTKTNPEFLTNENEPFLSIAFRQNNLIEYRKIRDS